MHEEMRGLLLSRHCLDLERVSKRTFQKNGFFLLRRGILVYADLR